MHVLILNTHDLHAQFLYKAMRYENIGVDLCQAVNLSKIWYNQYEAIMVPFSRWSREQILSALRSINVAGKIPVLVISKTPPEKEFKKEMRKVARPIRFIGIKTPFETMIKTLRMMIKKQEWAEDRQTKLKVGDLSLDLESREVKRKGKVFYLRNKEFALLLLLMKHPGKVLTRTYILENVWDRNTSILSNTVDVHINRLRKKIDGGFEHKMIKTIPCIGYKLMNKKS